VGVGVETERVLFGLGLLSRGQGICCSRSVMQQGLWWHSQ